METCKVEFIHSTGQKIVLDFSLDDKGNLDYKPSFEPKITDLKANLGLSARLCELFLTALDNMNKTGDTKIEDDRPKRKLES